MHQPPWSQNQLKKSVTLGSGLGLIMGVAEAITLSFSIRLHLSLLEALSLMTLCIYLGGLMGALAGLISGFLSRIRRDLDLGCTRLALSMSLSTLLLSGWLIFPMAHEFYLERGLGTAITAALIPFMFAMVTWYNAFFWLRKTTALGVPKWGWRNICLGLSVVGLAFSTGNLQWQTFGGSRAILTDPDVILISMSGLRADSMPLLPKTKSATEKCLTMDNVISPMPDTRAAHFGLFTGQNPVMMSLSDEQPRLSQRRRTLTQVLAKEDYATAAFVSNRSLDTSSGLAKGFQVYDDRFSTLLRGSDHIQSLGLLSRLWDWTPNRRSSELTLALAQEWMLRNTTSPMFVWIHLDDLMPPYGRSDEKLSLTLSSDNNRLDRVKKAYFEELALLDVQLGAFFQSIEKRDVAKRPQIVTLIGDRGMGFGEGGGVGPFHGLHSALIQTLWMNCNSEPDSVSGTMSVPVRIMDVYNSILGQSPHPTTKKNDSADILPLATQSDFKGFSIFMQSKDVSGFGRDPIYGYQLIGPKTDVWYKYTYAPVSKMGRLTRPLNKDKSDISEQSPEIRKQLHDHVVSVIKDISKPSP